MKTHRLLAVACAASLLAAAGCSSSSDDHGTSDSHGGSAGASHGGTTEPSNGVLPNADPMPMPVAGKRYDNPQPRSNVKQGGTLTLPITEIPPNFNTWSVDGYTAYNADIDYWTTPQLFEYDVSGNPQPNKTYLQDVELVSKSPEVVKYTINPKARWNNGDPITWKAFRATWKTQSGATKKYNPSNETGYSMMKSVTKGTSDNVALVTFKKPIYPYQLVFQSLENPRNVDPDFYKNGWVGKPHNELRAGPYKIKSSDKSKLVLVPNEKWWGPEPKLDKIVYKQMEDTASINAFQNGQIDVASVSTADRLKQVQDMKGIRVQRGFRKRVSVNIVGKGSPLLKHRYARRAWQYGTDRKTLANIRFQGMDWKEKLPGSVLTFTWMDHYHDNLNISYDPDKAKKLMESHGWTMGDDGYYRKNGKIASYTYVDFGDDPTGAAMARAQQQMAKKVGLKMTIDNRKSARFSDTLNDGDFGVLTLSWNSEDPYGYYWNCVIYCTTAGNNFAGLGSKALDKQILKPQTVADRHTAITLGNKAEAKALDLGGVLPLYNGPTMSAVTSGLANTGAITGTAGYYSVSPEDVGWQK